MTTRKLVEFAMHHRDTDGQVKWHSFATNYATVELVCAASNLKLIRLNEFGQFRAIEENATRYLNS